MGNDHSIQIVLVVSGDTEEVQLMALLIISDLQQSTAIAQNSSALRFGKDHSPEHSRSHPRPLATLNLSTTCLSPHTRDRRWRGGGRHQTLPTVIGKLLPPAVSPNWVGVHAAHSHTLASYRKNTQQIPAGVPRLTCKYEAMTAAEESSCSVAEECARSHAHVPREMEEGGGFVDGGGTRSSSSSSISSLPAVDRERAHARHRAAHAMLLPCLPRF